MIKQRMKLGSDLLVRAWIWGLKFPPLLLTVSVTGRKLDNSSIKKEYIKSISLSRFSKMLILFKKISVNYLGG